ncbi:MAG TPA: damage-inducible protein DinB [Cyanobacteria bacterium UBA11372]|nr:damage-inducible protein DinB [Cyanobacteria bacterium UBA11372]
MLTTYFQMLARYNTLANRRLYGVCARLSDEERKQTRPAFFKSIHGTLNHIIVCDRVWMGRFEGQQIDSPQNDEILHGDFDQLWGARIEEDDRIEKFFSSITDEFLSGKIKYRDMQGRTHNDPVTLLVAHFFNKQTHHRGQIHDLLMQTEVAPPILDLHRIFRP